MRVAALDVLPTRKRDAIPLEEIMRRMGARRRYGVRNALLRLVRNGKAGVIPSVSGARYWAIVAVESTCESHRPDPSRLLVLGRMTDANIARQCNVARSTIQSMRARRGIPAFQR